MFPLRSAKVAATHGTHSAPSWLDSLLPNANLVPF